MFSCFSSFVEPYKTHSESKKTEENKRLGSFSPALLEALAQRFVGFGEHDVRPRVIQAGRIGGPGEGRERGNLPVTTPQTPVAKRAGGIMSNSHTGFVLLMGWWGIAKRIEYRFYKLYSCVLRCVMHLCCDLV